MGGCPRPGSGGGPDTERVAGGRGDGNSVRGDGGSTSRCVEHRGGTAPTARPPTPSPRWHTTPRLRHSCAHAGRLFAATGQWEYPGPSASGQVLVKKSKTSPWTVFEQTQSLRVQALDSFSIPSDQGLGPGHSLLVTQAIVAGRSRIQWLLDGANSFSLRNSYVLPARRRRSCVRGTRGEWGLVRLCRSSPDGSHSGSLVTSSPHLGVQSQARTHGGPARVAGCGHAEGDGLRRLWRGPVRHHQHDALSA